MRVIPLMTAAVVTAGLYYAVIERDALLAFARGEQVSDETASSDVSEPTDASATTAAASETVAPQAAGADKADNSGVRVVALRSTARGIDSAVVLDRKSVV